MEEGQKFRNKHSIFPEQQENQPNQCSPFSNGSEKGSLCCHSFGKYGIFQHFQCISNSGSMKSQELVKENKSSHCQSNQLYHKVTESQQGKEL